MSLDELERTTSLFKMNLIHLFNMNPTRFLGGLAVVAGGGALLGEPLLGADLFFDLAGSGVVPLQMLGLAAMLLGLLAIAFDVCEEKALFDQKRGPRR